MDKFNIVLLYVDHHKFDEWTTLVAPDEKAMEWFDSDSDSDEDDSEEDEDSDMDTD